MTTNALTTQSIKDLLTFPFRGKDWQSRFLIGVGLTLVGFIPFLPAIFQLGYFSRVMKQALNGEELELPAWEDWGRLAKDGLRLLGVNLIYTLPGSLVMMGSMLVYFFGFFPAMVFADRSSHIETVMPAAMFLLMGIMFLGMFLGNLLLFVGAVPLPFAMARVVEQDNFAAAFQLGEIHKLLWRNKAGYFTAWVVLAGVAAIVYWVFYLFNMTFIFMWVGFLLLIPFGFYLLMLMAGLFGQTYRESLVVAEISTSA